MQTLQGFRILDLSRLLPGPYATQILTDLGADVIKIERPPEGDYAREMAPFVEVRDAHGHLRIGAMFAQLNRGKRSVALDFDDPRGRDALLALARNADVLVESFRPGTLARRGLGFEPLRQANPRLIYCSLSGYGQHGPYRGRAGHDLNYVARAGILKLNGATAGAPVPPPVQIADLSGGMMCTLEILAAIIERERTGTGRYLDVSLFAAALSWMKTVVGAFQQATGNDPERGELPFAGAYPCYNVYETADGEHVVLGALEHRFWDNFCRLTDRPDLLQRQYEAAARDEVAAVIRHKSQAQWLALAEQSEVCLDPLLSVSEALAQPQARASVPNGIETRSAPRLGEHTIELLEEAGIAPTELAELENAGIIARAF
jgi:alpha-methylacyl-CoA racemase